MEDKPGRVFITDCEGPITKNDNAAELAEAFIPGGDRFFRKISLYDDYLAEVVKKRGYKAGDTLRLILPFFKAFGLDNRSMGKFSRRSIELIPQADCMLQQVSDVMPTYIVSTSYSSYIKSVCEVIEFPFMNTYSTVVDLDRYPLSEAENKALKDLHARILALPDFLIPSVGGSLDDLSGADKQALQDLDEIFWGILPGMRIFRIIEDVNPIGGREKARAIEQIMELEDASLHDVIYVGDSITDVDAFRMVKSGGGLAVSFNGNDWAVKEAAYAVTAQNALPIGWVAMMFLNRGLAGFEDLTVSPVNEQTVERISRESSRIRKSVRTEKIGTLG